MISLHKKWNFRYGFLSKCDQIRNSHLLKKFVMENFIFCAVYHLSVQWHISDTVKRVWCSLFAKIANTYPVDTGRKLNVHKTFNLCSETTGNIIDVWQGPEYVSALKIWNLHLKFALVISCASSVVVLQYLMLILTKLVSNWSNFGCNFIVSVIVLLINT